MNQSDLYKKYGARITDDELAEYGPRALETPHIIPRIAELMAQIPEQVERDKEQKLSSQGIADAEEILGDQPVFDNICGLPILRNISAAMYNILMKSKNACVCGEDKNGVSADDLPEYEWVNHQGFVVFLMAYPDVRDLVRWSMQGPEKIEEEYLVWSMENLSLESLIAQADGSKIDSLLTAINSAAGEMPSDEEGEGQETSAPKSDG